MANDIPKKPGKPMTRAEREAAEDRIFADGGWEIVRNGVTYRVDGQGNLTPVKGTDAQKAIKKQRKPRKPKTGSNPQA